MILVDEQFVLRQIEEADADVLLEMINDPSIEASVVGWSYPVSKQQQLQWINNQHDSSTIRYAVDAGSGIVGAAIISSIDNKNKTANLNIKIRKSEMGKGYATRAIKLMIGYCFDELNLNCLTANVIEDNEKSQALWTKFGFKQDGLLRSRVFKNGEYKNLIAYSLLKDEYEN